MTESYRSADMYEVDVPDTLDLAERAELSINFLTSTADPAFDYATPVWIRLDTNPPYMHHGDYTSVCEVKVVRALPLMTIDRQAGLLRQDPCVHQVALWQCNLRSLYPKPVQP